MKVKSSLVLNEALHLILNRKRTHACSAIYYVEIMVNGQAVSEAQHIFNKFKPAYIPDEMRESMGWWPIGSPDRIAALNEAIKVAKSRND